MDEKMHQIVLEQRRRLSVSCCNQVESFNENEVRIIVGAEVLTICGSKLKVEEVSASSGEVNITGERIDSMTYSQSAKASRENLFGRLFK